MHQSMLLMCYGQNNGTLERNVFFIWLHPAIKQISQYINCEILTTSKDTAGVVVELWSLNLHWARWLRWAPCHRSCQLCPCFYSHKFMKDIKCFEKGAFSKPFCRWGFGRLGCFVIIMIFHFSSLGCRSCFLALLKQQRKWWKCEVTQFLHFLTFLRENPGWFGQAEHHQSKGSLVCWRGRALLKPAVQLCRVGTAPPGLTRALPAASTDSPLFADHFSHSEAEAQTFRGKISRTVPVASGSQLQSRARRQRWWHRWGRREWKRLWEALGEGATETLVR